MDSNDSVLSTFDSTIYTSQLNFASYGHLGGTTFQKMTSTLLGSFLFIVDFLFIEASYI